MTLAQLLCMSVISIQLPNSAVACEHMDYLVEQAQKNKVRPRVLVALINEESRWKPEAVSRSGACGLTQVLPKYTRPKVTCNQLKDPRKSIEVGAKTLAFWVYDYGKGRYKRGLCGYNGGYRCKKLKSSKRYANRVLKLAKRIENKIKSIKEYHKLVN